MNSGGQRQGGSITAPNPNGVVRCVRSALRDAAIAPAEIDLVNGHFTATAFDVAEVQSWREALELAPEQMPRLQATKAYLGHGLGASGAWEAIASLLQLQRGFVHRALNCEDLHPALAPFARSLGSECEANPPRVAVKAGFGFGDVNACVVFRAWSEHE